MAHAAAADLADWMAAGDTAPRRAVALAALGDDALVERIADGDERAWQELTRRHLGAIVGYAWHMLRDRAEAEDVAQELMVRLMRKAETWEPGGAQVKTWLFRVAINLCIDRQRARRTTSLELVDDQADPSSSGARIARDQALRQAVGNAVDALPARQKEALTLVHYQGFSQRETAAALDISVEAVEFLSSRARRTLKKTLRGQADDLLEEW